MDLLEAIGAWLIKMNRATAIGTDLFFEYAPPEGNCITIYEYGGSAQPIQVKALNRGIQICIRDTDAEQALTNAWDIYDLLQRSQQEDGRVDFTDSFWGQVHLRTSPLKLKVDEKGQITWVFNLGITVPN